MSKKSSISPLKAPKSCVTVCAFMGCIGGIASAQFLVTPPTVGPVTLSPNIVTNANVINLYMASNWNAVAPAGLGETKEALDSWTQALIASSYFTFAGQYGIGTPHFVGGFNTSPTCAVPSTPSGVIRPWHIGGFVNCNLTTSPLADLIHNTPIQNIVVNVFADPSKTIWVPFGGTCAGGQMSGYHWVNQDPSTFLTPFTVNSASTTCNSNFAALTSTIAHELIEAITDPIAPDGWLHRYGPGGVNIAHTLAFGEVSDICGTGGTMATPGNAIIPSGNIPFLGPLASAQASFYWSNSAQACVPAWPFTTPTVSQPVAIQEDLNQDQTAGAVTLSISGSGFGNAFAALQSASTLGTAPDTTQNTPYFFLIDANTGANAGNSLRSGGGPIAVGWTWTDTAISMRVSTLPGSHFLSCDGLRFTIWNPADGNSVSGSTTLPGPADIAVEVPQFVPVGVPVTALVSAIPAPNTVLATPTKIAFQVDGVPQLIPPVIGKLPVTVTFPPPTGSHQLNVSASPAGTDCSNQLLAKFATVNTGPRVDSIFPDHGPAAGDTVVTITGQGLSQTTAVMFGTQNAAAISIIDDTEVKVTTAPASLGQVPISLTANAIKYPYPGQSGQVQFTFFNPGVPLLTDLSTCQADYIGIHAWGNPGKSGVAPPLANAIISVKANHVFLRPPVIRFLDSNGTGQLTAIAELGSVQPSVTVAMGLVQNTADSASIGVDSIGECPWWGISPAQINPLNIIQAVQGCPACGFSDVPATQANSYIYGVVAWGLMAGIGNKFQPNGAVSRDQLVATLQRVAGPRATEASRRVFGAMGENNLRGKQNGVTRRQAMQFLDTSLQRAGTTRVANPEHLFTRGDLARALWLYARKAVPASVTQDSR